MAETFTDRLKLSKRDTGDLNWGQGANANLEAIDAHVQQALLRPPRTLLATLGNGAVGADLLGNTVYFYKVTAINAAGETTEGKIPVILEAQVTEPLIPLPIIIQWEPVKGATGYKVYKATTSGQEKLLASVSGESTSTFTDNGNTASNPAIAVPTTNTASAIGASEQIIFNDACAPTGDDKLKFSRSTGILTLTGQIKIVDGQQLAGKVLTSDSLGLASWQSVASGSGDIGTIVTREEPTGAIDGTNTTFNLSHQPKPNSEEVYLNGLLQEPNGNDYNITGQTITFMQAPLSENRIRVSYRW
jgi:hypothetical protein